MSVYQFLRVECCGLDAAAGIIAEADRDPLACKHVAKPEPAKWLVGNPLAIRRALKAHMDEPAPVRSKSGAPKYRCRRKDHRCLVSGIVSHPTPMQVLTPHACEGENSRAEAIEFRQQVYRWLRDTQQWLRDQWGERLMAVCLHRDESHPHLHFFVVGDAQRLHPGLRAEMVDDRRIKDRKARSAAYKLGIQKWLDDYHRDVGAKNGLARGDGSVRPLGRIKNRQTYLAIAQLRGEISSVLDAQVREELARTADEIYDGVEHRRRGRISY